VGKLRIVKVQYLVRKQGNQVGAVFRGVRKDRADEEARAEGPADGTGCSNIGWDIASAAPLTNARIAKRIRAIAEQSKLAQTCPHIDLAQHAFTIIDNARMIFLAFRHRWTNRSREFQADRVGRIIAC
jgi:hypothetical protein